MDLRLGIIADDLTGGCECAALACRRGLHASVAVDHQTRPDAEAPVQVVVTDSRHAAPAEAASRVRAAIDTLRQAGCTVLVKKTDSALRGPIAAELAALRASRPDLPLLYCPAYPQVGRTVSGGELFIDGVPLGATAFARDPQAPVASGVIPALLRPALVVESLSIESMRAGWRPAGGACVVVDGSAPSHLDAAAGMVAPDGALWAGPGGIVAALLDRLVLTAPPLPPAPPAIAGSALVVVGSQHPATLAQLQACDGTAIEHLHLPAPACFQERVPATWLGANSRRFQRARTEGRSAVLFTARRPEDVAVYRRVGADYGVPAEELGPRLTDRLANVAAALAAEDPAMPLILCGGASAQAVLAHLGVRRLTIVAELTPGVAAARDEHGRMIVTKNGAFGEPRLLCDMLSVAPAQQAPVDAPESQPARKHT